ncbi:hypothetical protein [Brevibacillus sp. NRS-1366]|uniref:hypothetical protein n=1 Tax=Brevibacillus sp. NRS-1366 TaxID=3233899 RepID=UPI003D219537
MQNLNWARKVNEFRHELDSFAKKNEIQILKYCFNEEGKVLLHFVTPKIAEQYKNKINQIANKYKIEVTHNTQAKSHILIKELHQLVSPQKNKLYIDEKQSTITVYIDLINEDQANKILSTLKTLAGDYEITILKYKELIKRSRFNKLTFEEFKEMVLRNNNGSVDWSDVAYNIYLSTKDLKEQQVFGEVSVRT